MVEWRAQLVAEVGEGGAVHGQDTRTGSRTVKVLMGFPIDRVIDLVDRMLVSQAIVHGLAILGPDPLITQYPIRTAW